jgi:signal peptidase II
LFCIVVDQASKWLVTTLAPEWIYRNTGIAFSLALPKWAIAVVFLILIGTALYYWISWTPAERYRLALPLGLIAGGAISNAIDRVAHGAVLDFINLRVWPVFNLADTALVIGTLLLLWYSWKYSTSTSHDKRGSKRQSGDVA